MPTANPAPAQSATLQDRINGAYAGLSDKLRVAAGFVAENPVDIATRSLRAVATTSGVSPATFSRLARALGYADYEEMREDARKAVEQKLSPFSERAHALRETARGQQSRTLFQHQAAACLANIEQMLDETSTTRLEAAVEALHGARSVLLVGSMGSAGLIDYFGYMSQWFKPDWKIAGRNGTQLSSALSRMAPGDVVFALAKTPYAHRTVAALNAARDRGATTLAVTDSRTSPVLEFADHGFVVPTDSPQFFSSYAATLVLMESIVSMLLTRAGPEAEDMIRAAELQIERLGENWSP